MKPTIFDRHKFTSPKQFYKLYLLLCFASTSMFWVLATQPTRAQVTNDQYSSSSQFNIGGLVPVPGAPAPTNQTRFNLQTVPPPPDQSQSSLNSVFDNGSVSTTSSQSLLNFSTSDDVKNLENSLISQQTQRKKRSSKPSQILPTTATPPQLSLKQPHNAVGGDNSDSALGLITPVNNSVNANRNQVIAQNMGQPAMQEFAAPGAPPPSFNQLLNNTQTSVAPLPPVVGENPQPQWGGTSKPTFNQLLNNRVGGQPGVAVGTAPTFNQLLNSQVGQPAVNNVAGNSFEQILNSSTTEQPFVANSPPPTFNQILNSQGGAFPTQGEPLQQQPTFPQASPPSSSQQPGSDTRPLFKSTALGEPSLRLEGVYVSQKETSARARLAAIYPLTPQALFGATLDLVSNGSSFDDSRNEGLNINELYFATSLGGLPNLRFVIGQMDLTSYFDRNSFAKDGASQFFNPVFQTNPALSATGIAPRPGLLVNWSVTDNIDAKAAVFSSSDRLSNFSLDGFAGEVGVRFGNAIVRGTYSTARDAGNRDTFPEAFGISRGNGRFGPLKDDREEAYGLNAEVFIPNLKLGLFGRYGRYENRDIGEGADTYVIGASLLDLFTPDDRLGLAYGQALTNDSLRRSDRPDVVEMYYDFPFLPNLRVGFTVQGRDSFEETVLGVRVKSEFDVTPRGRVRR